MGKYIVLWEYIGQQDADRLHLSFLKTEQILGFPIDHSFLTYKKRINIIRLEGRKNLNEKSNRAF